MEPSINNVQNTAVAKINAEAIRRQTELFNKGDVAGGVAFFAPNTRNHGRAVGRAGVMRVLSDIFTTFPDSYTVINDLVAVDDMVIVRQTSSGTHKGVSHFPTNGGLLMGVAPTGKRYSVESIHWYTLADGLIIEHRATRDDIGMIQQLGLLPATTL
ncbi:hypothetical protein BH10PSE13_BH10PSE13_02170 [soil metagenome]